MKNAKFLFIFFVFFQFTSSVIARDDLIVSKEVAFLKNFSNKNGYGSCLVAVNEVQSLPRNFVNACESLATKVPKAIRHCSTASDTAYCLESILDNNGDEVLGLIRCCGTAQKIGKMR